MSISGLVVTENFEENTGDNRESKVLPIFQVVRFPNDVCSGQSRNGTCYTAEECSNKNGLNSGSCASGFGVCCIISLSCGGTTSENSSYIVQGLTTTAPASPCTYKICPCSTDICRIRYDMTTMVLAGPAGPSTTSVYAADPQTLDNVGTGDCTTDQFNVASPGAMGSPIICGKNSGQHIFIDSDGSSCHNVNINVGGTTSTSRQWDIFVTQYTCGQEDLGGPPGCLQYFTGDTGLVKSFNYDPSNTATAAAALDTIHLQNQHYQICVRRETGMCYICWASWSTTPGSFGIGPADAAGDKGVVAACTLDFVFIPHGTTAAIAAITTPNLGLANRFCGRHLSTATASTAEETICSRVYPFRIGVHFNDSEMCAADDTHMCEVNVAAAGNPGGILGFALGYKQQSC